MPAPAAPTTLPPVPPRTIDAAQIQLAAMARALTAQGWDCAPHHASDGEAMLVAISPDGTTTCLLTTAATGLRLQCLVEEAWLDTACEGPPTRILGRMAQIAGELAGELEGPIAGLAPSP